MVKEDQDVKSVAVVLYVYMVKEDQDVKSVYILKDYKIKTKLYLMNLIEKYTNICNNLK